MNGVFLVACAVISAGLFILLITYNGLVHQRQDIRLAWAKMDELLKVRYRLAAELIKLVQGASPDMALKLPPVISAKNQAAVAIDPEKLAVAESALTSAIKEVTASGDSDSTLSREQQWILLSTAISENQKQISQACRRYNDRVDALNVSMIGFPHHLTAKVIGLGLQPIFKLID